jgi:hypothetical protein
MLLPLLEYNDEEEDDRGIETIIISKIDCQRL